MDLEFGDIGVEDTPYPFLLFVSQAETELALERRMNELGIEVERPVELLGFTQDPEGVSARLLCEDDREETVRQRLQVYHSNNRDLLSYYRDHGRLREVQGLGTIEEIYQKIVGSVVRA